MYNGRNPELLSAGILVGDTDGLDELDFMDSSPVRKIIRRVKRKITRRRGKAVPRRKRAKAVRRRKTGNRRPKRKRASGKIRHTKNGQPYKILANGRARFIKRRRR